MRSALVIAGEELRRSLEGEPDGAVEKMNLRTAALRRLVSLLAKIAPEANFTPISVSLSIAVATDDAATIQKLRKFFADNPEKGSIVNNAVTSAIF